MIRITEILRALQAADELRIMRSGCAYYVVDGVRYGAGLLQGGVR